MTNQEVVARLETSPYFTARGEEVQLIGVQANPVRWVAAVLPLKMVPAHDIVTVTAEELSPSEVV